MKPNSGFAAAFAAVFAFVACSSSSIVAGQNAATGGSGGTSAKDGGVSADAGTAPRDAACEQNSLGQCAWTPCTTSLAAACASSSLQCVMSWPSNVAAFCSSYPNADYYAATLNCGPYRLFEEGPIDSVTYFYYSAATGQLVAVVSPNAQVEITRCIGGPSGFVDPKCNGPQFTCPDAGAGP